MKKILVIILIIVCFPITKVDAVICPSSEVARLRRIASNINTSIDYVEGNGRVDFSITLVNLHPDLYLVDETRNRRIPFTGREMTLRGYGSGERVRYTVRTTVLYCEDIVIGTIRVNLPTYNPFYMSVACNGIEHFHLCFKWSTHGMSYQDFLIAVNNYRETIDNPITEEPELEYVTIRDIMINFLNEGYLYVALVIIIIGSSVGIYISKKKETKYY